MNEPIKNCTTCAHQIRPDWARWDSEASEYSKCVLHGGFCEHMRNWKTCDLSRDWTAMPPPKPRRSLRQWLYDTFWK